MNNYNYAKRRIRLINWFIDGTIVSVIWTLMLVPLFPYIVQTKYFQNLEPGTSIDLSFTILPFYFVYYLFSEGIFKTTIGKMITRTKLIHAHGNKISFYNILIRTLCRLIPLEQLSYLSNNPTGIHDSFSDTRVINKK